MKKIPLSSKLRWCCLMLGAGLMGATVCPGQEATADTKQAPPPKPPAAAQQSLTFQADMLSRIFGTPVTVDGAIPRAIKSGQPLQMINPFAPKEYGDGYDNITVDKDKQKATGFSLFNLKF